MQGFHYTTGELVLAGDRIQVINERGVVELVILQGDPAANDYSCIETGGVLLKFDNGDVQLWPWIDEDLELLARGAA